VLRLSSGKKVNSGGGVRSFALGSPELQKLAFLRYYAAFAGRLQHGQFVSSLNRYTRQFGHGMPRSIRRGPTLGAGLPTAVFIAAPFGPCWTAAMLSAKPCRYRFPTLVVTSFKSRLIHPRKLTRHNGMIAVSLRNLRRKRQRDVGCFRSLHRLDLCRLITMNDSSGSRLATIVCPFRRTVGELTTSEPVAVRTSALVQSLPVPSVPFACTVKDVVPAGVEPVVLIVNVEVRSGLLATPVRVLGLNDAVAPVGKAVVMLSATVQLPFPANATVIVYVAELPRGIEAGV
jgi:hypothetical protein